jgi:hypothetical protein
LYVPPTNGSARIALLHLRRWRWFTIENISWDCLCALDVRAGLQQGAEFRTEAGEELAISVLVGEIRVLKYFQKRMPYGLFVAVRNLRRVLSISYGGAP